MQLPHILSSAEVTLFSVHLLLVRTTGIVIYQILTYKQQKVVTEGFQVRGKAEYACFDGSCRASRTRKIPECCGYRLLSCGQAKWHLQYCDSSARQLTGKGITNVQLGITSLPSDVVFCHAAWCVRFSGFFFFPSRNR